MSLLNMEAIQNIKNLQEKVGKDLLKNLLQLYTQSTPEIIANMKNLLNCQSYEDLSREAHSLKSSSANIGAEAMAEICKKIEYKIIGEEEATDNELSQYIEQLHELYPNTLTELKGLG